MGIRTSLSRRPPPVGRQADATRDAGPEDFQPGLLGFRAATRRDWPSVRRLLIEAFGRADESELVERLRASRDIACEFVAEYRGSVIGYVSFCRLDAAIDGRPIRAAGLAPVAVAAEVEGNGVGTRLVAFGLECLRGEDYAGVFVVGDARFYGRFGFSARLAERFESPWSGEHHQALEFAPGTLRGEAGGAHWPEPFSLL